MNRFCLKEMIWVFSFVTRELPLRCMLVFLPTEISARKRPQNQLENMRLKFCVYLESWSSNSQLNCSDLTRHNFLKIFRVFYVTWIEKKNSTHGIPRFSYQPNYSLLVHLTKYVSSHALWLIFSQIQEATRVHLLLGKNTDRKRKPVSESVNFSYSRQQEISMKVFLEKLGIETSDLILWGLIFH